jgi:hypothetical protein
MTLQAVSAATQRKIAAQEALVFVAPTLPPQSLLWAPPRLAHLQTIHGHLHPALTAKTVNLDKAAVVVQVRQTVVEAAALAEDAAEKAVPVVRGAVRVSRYCLSTLPFHLKGRR